MAQIRKYLEEGGWLFPIIPAYCVSAMLYDLAKKRVERKIGGELRKITAKYLAEKYRKHAVQGGSLGMYNAVTTMAVIGREPVLAMSIVAANEFRIAARIHFPYFGEAQRIHVLLRDIVAELRLEGRAVVPSDGIAELEVEFQFINGDAPVFDPRCKDERGRDTYCCTRGIWHYECEQRIASERKQKEEEALKKKGEKGRQQKEKKERWEKFKE